VFPEKHVFFAKRTQFQSMFTEDFEKIQSQLKPFQTQLKPIFTPLKANLKPISPQKRPPPLPERGSVSRSNGYNPRPSQTTMTADLIPLNIGDPNWKLAFGPRRFNLPP
jgi:hypothetical protein